MTARESLVLPPQARHRAGQSMNRPMDVPSGPRRAKANCGFCGQAWFGDVAYCPYCGRPSAGASADTGAQPPPEGTVVPGLEQEPGGSAASARTPQERAEWNIVLALAAALALVAIGVREIVITPRDGAGPRPAPAPVTAAMKAPPAPDRGAFASTAQARPVEPVAPRADVEPSPRPQAPQPAPPAPRRSLCSAASEAAGLCNPR